jgi:hypothetical protein
MMDERQIREEAWQEGRNAGYRQQAMGDLADRPLNPYTPVEYTPTNQEIIKAVLNTFTEDEMLRYFHKREGALAEDERWSVVNKLEIMRLDEKREAWKTCAYVSPTRTRAIEDCIALIKSIKD